MKGFKVAHLNARSLLPKFVQFRDLVLKHRYDIIGVSETWLTPDVCNSVIEIYGCHLYRNDRVGRGGGVAIYVSDIYKCRIIPSGDLIEQLWLSVSLNGKLYIFGVSYRPPNENCFWMNLKFQSRMQLL